MPAIPDPTTATIDLRKPRRLHPLAILMPFGSYSKPKKLGSLAVPIWTAVALIATITFLANLAADDIRNAGDNGATLTFTTGAGTPTPAGEPGAGTTGTRKDDSWSFLPPINIFITVTDLLLVAFLFYKWWFFRWWVDDGAIWTAGGATIKWKRRVSTNQIVAVDRTTNMLQRALRVSKMAIETTAHAGSSADVTLGSLSRRDADQLQAYLNHDMQELDPDQRRAQSLAFARPTMRELFAAGAFSFQVSRTVVLLFVIYQVVNARTSGWLSSGASELSRKITEGNHLTRNLIAAFAGLILLFWLTSVLDYLVSFNRFDLSRRGSWLLLRSGVLRKTVRWVRFDAIEGYESVSTPLQRRIGRSTLRMRIPAYGAAPGYKLVLHPSITPPALQSLMSELEGMVDASRLALSGEGMHALASASRNSVVLRWPVRIVALTAILTAAMGLIAPDYFWSPLLLLLLAIPTAIWGDFSWRNAAWHARDGGWLVVRQGTINHHSIAARVDRMQYLQWTHPTAPRRPIAWLTLTLCIATSGNDARVTSLLTRLSRTFSPSIVTLRRLTPAEAVSIATAIGEPQSLPPEIDLV